MESTPGPQWSRQVDDHIRQMQDDAARAENQHRQVILDRVKFGMTKVITETAMSGVRASVSAERGYGYYEQLGANTMIKLRVDMLAQQHPPQTIRNTVLVPRLATPWQHFRARHWDKWWMMWARKRPLTYIDEPVPVTVEVRSQTLYPHHRLALDDQLGAGALRFDVGPAWSTWTNQESR